MAREIARLIAVPAACAAVCALPGEAAWRLVRRALWACVALCGAWGVAQFCAGGGVRELTSGALRATGPFAYPNTLGYVLLLGVNLLVGDLLLGPRRDGRRARLLAVAALVGALALTASFTVLGLALLSAVAFLIIARRLSALALVGALAVAAAPLMAPRVAMILRSEPAVDREEGVGRNTLTARFVIWPALLDAFRAHPIVGWGLRSAPLVNPVREIERGVGSDPHNDLLLFLVEGGIVGLAGFCAYHLTALSVLARRGDRRAGTAAYGGAVGLWVTYAAMMAGSLVNNVLSFTAVHLLFWGWAAATLAQRSPAASR